MVSIVRKPLLALALFCVLALVPARAGVTGNGYTSTAVRSGSTYSGCVTFNPGGSFGATFALQGGAAGGGFLSLVGSYTELDLLFVSFWEVGPNRGLGSSVAGSGISLFFGLLVFGSVEEVGPQQPLSISGVLSGCIAGLGRAEPAVARGETPASPSPHLAGVPSRAGDGSELGERASCVDRHEPRVGSTLRTIRRLRRASAYRSSRTTERECNPRTGARSVLACPAKTPLNSIV